MPPPKWIKPQLSRLADEAPTGADWLHEIKYDGYRMHARLEDGGAQLLTRTGLDWSKRYRFTIEALTKLPVKSAYIDGELCALRPDGVPAFSRLQAAMDEGRTDQLSYMVFDLLYLDGESTAGLPAEGTMTYFGTYSVTETDSTIAIRVEGSSFPNWNGSDQERGVAITGDQLTLTVCPRLERLSRSFGSAPNLGLEALLTAVSVASISAIGPMRPIIAGFIALLLLGFGMQRLDRSGHQQAQNTTAISPAIAISTSASMTRQWSRGSSGRCAIKIVSRASSH